MEQNKQYQNGEQDRRLQWLENHYSNLNSEMGDIKTNLAKVAQDVCWLKKNYWMVAGAATGGLIIGLINLLFK